MPAERRVVPLPDGGVVRRRRVARRPAMTAHRALTVAEDGPRRLGPGALDGRTVLVAGGAGAVGHAAIQLARWAGATVITTVSGPEKAALAAAAGAHHVVNYRERRRGRRRSARSRPDGVDIVVEVAPAQNVGLDLAVIADRGTVAIYANNGGDEVTSTCGRRSRTNAGCSSCCSTPVGPRRAAAAAEDVTAAVA